MNTNFNILGKIMDRMAFEKWKENIAALNKQYFAIFRRDSHSLQTKTQIGKNICKQCENSHIRGPYIIKMGHLEEYPFNYRGLHGEVKEIFIWNYRFRLCPNCSENYLIELTNRNKIVDFYLNNGGKDLSYESTEYLQSEFLTEYDDNKKSDNFVYNNLNTIIYPDYRKIALQKFEEEFKNEDQELEDQISDQELEEQISDKELEPKEDQFSDQELEPEEEQILYQYKMSDAIFDYLLIAGMLFTFLWYE